MTPTRTTLWTWPIVAAALPCASGARFVRRRVAATADRANHDEEAAWRRAVEWGFTAIPETGGRPAERAAWVEAFRLTRLIDHVDLYLNLTRSARWLERHVEVEGAWPACDPFLAVTSHWGAGLWSLPHLRRSGHKARFLQRRLDPAALAHDPWLARYARLRVYATRRALGRPLIYTGGASDEIAATWARGESVVALFDVPPDPGRSTLVLPIGAAGMRIPVGLLRLASTRRIAVVPFAVAVDRVTGARRLTIGEALVDDDPAALGLALARHLETLLRADSAAWHLWPYAADLFVRRAE